MDVSCRRGFLSTRKLFPAVRAVSIAGVSALGAGSFLFIADFGVLMVCLWEDFSLFVSADLADKENVSVPLAVCFVALPLFVFVGFSGNLRTRG